MSTPPTPKPTALTPIPENLPPDLTTGDMFLVWDWWWDPKLKKWTKPPLRASDGVSCGATDRKNGASLSEAYSIMRRRPHDGVGRMLFADEGLVGWDLDGCRNPETGEIAPWAQKIINEFASYTEVSPSGTGVRIFVFGTLPPKGRRKDHVECYCSGRYLTLTGCHLPGTPRTVEHRQEQIDTVHRRVFAHIYAPKPERPKPAQPTTPITRDTEAILERIRKTTKGRRLHDDGDWKGGGYESHSHADQALCNLYVAAGADRSQTDDLFRRSGLIRDKWDKRHYTDGRTYGDGTLDKAFDGSVETWPDDTTGTEGPNKQDAQSPPDPILDPDDLPDDLPSLKRLIVDLMRRQQADRRRADAAEARAIAAEARAIAAEARVLELSLLQSKTMAAFRSKNFGSEKATGVALAFEILNQQTADPTRTEFPICNERLADQTGMSAGAVADHVKEKLPRVVDPLTGEVIELFERKLRYTPGGTDPTTGESIAPKTQAVFVPKVDPMRIIDLIATAAPVSGRRKNNHGGKADRGRLCPDHPHADVVKRVTYHCAECDRLLDEDAPITLPNEQVAQTVDDDLPGYSLAPRPIGQDAESVQRPPSPHRGSNYRASPEPNYHNDAPTGSIADAWQHGQPLPGFEKTPVDRWSS
jgi:putative DNA primase/helicase